MAIFRSMELGRSGQQNSSAAAVLSNETSTKKKPQAAFRLEKEAEFDANMPSSRQDALFGKIGTALNLHSNVDNK